jgi:hypothetical protein
VYATENWFEPTQAGVRMVKQFLGELNPIVDMADLPLQPHIRSIQVTDTAVVVSG